ncbi:aldo/keto reductase [Yersinia enterocolitica]|nr:aldo/keto reductase [Yersinia enterocolitica]
MKSICLGTAMWGDGIDRDSAFAILDEYYSQGFRTIDTASNYPINDIPSCLHASENILSEWIKCHGIHDLSIIYKFGSIVNSNVPDNDLSAFNVSRVAEYLFETFNDNIGCLMVHWDNRRDFELINETLSQMLISCLYLNCKPGLSGIIDVDSYFNIMSNKNMFPCDIEVKSNFLYRDELRYSIFNSHSTLWAYGVSCNGLKIQDFNEKNSLKIKIKQHDFYLNLLSPQLRDIILHVMKKHHIISNFYLFSIAFSEFSKNTDGYIIAPRNRGQLLDFLSFREKLYDYSNHEELYLDLFN